MPIYRDVHQSSPPSLKIRKYTQDVHVRDLRGDERQVRVFLSEDVDRDGRNERLQDIFGDRQFVPVRVDDRVEFCNSRHLLWVRLDLMAAIDELDPQAENDPAANSARLKLELEDGTSLEGSVRYYLPAGMRRVGDFLNSNTRSRWFPVRTSEWLYLVNREHVVKIAPMEG